MTGRGYIGFASYEVAVGNAICILREEQFRCAEKSSRRTYKCTEECNAHGIMYGKSADFEGVKHEEFVLE